MRIGIEDVSYAAGESVRRLRDAEGREATR